MPDRSHHGEGQHDERDMAVPAVPGAGLVVIEAKFVLGRLEAVFDRPALALDPDQHLDACSSRAPGGEEGEITVRSEEHTSELQSLMRISYAVFCLKKKKQQNKK